MNGTLTKDMPMADYLAIEACSASTAKALATASPYAWKNRTATSTAAQLLGTAAHMAILEPERFESDVLIQPSADLRTNAGKETILAWLTTIVGEPTVRPPAKAAVGTVLDLYLAELRPRLAATRALVIAQADADACNAMRDAVWGREHTRSLMEAEGHCELTGQCQDPDFDIPLKIRPDKLLSGQPIVVSLKTCQSVAERDYLRTAWGYGYHGAAWFYSRAMQMITGERHRYWEISVEASPPHDVMLLEYTDREIEAGEAMMRSGMEQYQRCTESGEWPGAGWDWTERQYTIVQIGRTDVL